MQNHVCTLDTVGRLDESDRLTNHKPRTITRVWARASVRFSRIASTEWGMARIWFVKPSESAIGGKCKKKKKPAPILALCLWFGCMISSEQKWSFSFSSALCFAHYVLRNSLSSSQLAAAHSDCCMLVICKHTIVLLTGKLVMKLLHLVERCRTPAHKVQEAQSGKPKRQETERKWKLHVLRRHFFSMVTDLIRDPTAHTSQCAGPKIWR